MSIVNPCECSVTEVGRCLSFLFLDAQNVFTCAMQHAPVAVKNDFQH